MKKWRLVNIIWGCLLWTFFFIFFFMVRFPGDSFLKWTEYKIEEMIKADISIVGINIQRDISFFIERIDFKNNIGEEPLNIALRKILLKPDLKSLIRGVPSFKYRAHIFKNGILAGTFYKSKDMNLVINWEGINIREIKLPFFGKNFPLSIDTEGKATLIIAPKTRVKGSEFIELTAEGLNLPFNYQKLPAFVLPSQQVLYGKVKILGIKSNPI